ncbi:hypothetical protein GCM10009558_028750 [Virgisporangium aurantiacum]
MLTAVRPHTDAVLPIPAGGLAGRIVGVWFNPWAHQSADQVWAGLTRQVIDAVGGALLGDCDAAERYWFVRNLGRLDRRKVHQQLWKRIRSPLLVVSAFAVLAPLIAQVAIKPSDEKLFGWPVPSGLLAAAVPALLLLLGLAHTAGRYVFARASSFLPGDLFSGPVVSGALAQTDATRDAALHDPYFHARSGYLYLVQHSVKALLQDLEHADGELVVFVDDLDRCAPSTTAQVLEAINLFLSESFPRARFVLGLDPAVVAAHIDRTYTDLLGTPTTRHPGDPSPGWTFLRKLIQLPVTLPSVPDTGLDRLLTDTLGPTTALDHPDPRSSPTIPPTPTTLTQPSNARTVHDPAPSFTPPPTQGPEPAASRMIASTMSVTDTQMAWRLERHPVVRERLRERLADQPDRSVREAKRLMTIWQFAVRLLQENAPLTGDDAVRRAQQLVVVAELLTRWPAQQRLLRAPYTDPHTPRTRGLDALAAAVHDDLAWNRTIARLGQPLNDASTSTALRRLLHDYDGSHVTDLYGQLG